MHVRLKPFFPVYITMLHLHCHIQHNLEIVYIFQSKACHQTLHLHIHLLLQHHLTLQFGLLCKNLYFNLAMQFLAVKVYHKAHLAVNHLVLYLRLRLTPVMV